MKRDLTADVVLDYTGDTTAGRERVALPRCPDCGAVSSTRPHAPHMVGRVLVDCAGRPC